MSHYILPATDWLISLSLPYKAVCNLIQVFCAPGLQDSRALYASLVSRYLRPSRSRFTRLVKLWRPTSQASLYANIQLFFKNDLGHWFLSLLTTQFGMTTPIIHTPLDQKILLLVIWDVNISLSASIQLTSDVVTILAFGFKLPLEIGDSSDILIPILTCRQHIQSWRNRKLFQADKSHKLDVHMANSVDWRCNLLSPDNSHMI